MPPQTNWKPIHSFGALWNNETDRGVIVVRGHKQNEQATLGNLGIEKFTMLTSLLQGAHSAAFHPKTGSIRAGVAPVDD